MGRLSVLPDSTISKKEKMCEETSINSSTNKSGYILRHILNKTPLIKH